MILTDYNTFHNQTNISFIKVRLCQYRLPKVFKKALEGALTCSNDPVCSLSNGQGRDSLNLAACYSCALIPETSCEEYNIFLDRGVLIGTFKDRTMGFFSSSVYGDTGITRDEQNDVLQISVGDV